MDGIGKGLAKVFATNFKYFSIFSALSTKANLKLEDFEIRADNLIQQGTYS